MRAPAPTKRTARERPFWMLVEALAAGGNVVLGYNPRTGQVEARLEQPIQQSPCGSGPGDASDRHIGVDGATRGD